MAKYLLIYRNPPDPSEPPSAEEMQAVLAAWGTWIGKFSATGNILDAGDGLLGTGKQLRAGGVVSDGPFMESKEVLGGYSVIQADSYDHAVAISKDNPIFSAGGWIEIRELAGYG